VIGTHQHYRQILLADVNDAIDDSGRPLGEIRAAECVRRNVTTKYARCGYGGSRARAGRLINLSALDQVNTDWPSVLGLLCYIRSGCISPNCTNPSLIEVARTAAICLTVPAYLKFRESSTGVIPSFVSAFHKMSAGLFGICKNRIIDRVSRGCAFATITETPVSLYRYAEDSGAFLSRTGFEACAAPPIMIVRALRALVLGERSDPVEMQRSQELMSPLDGLLAYGDAVIALTILINLLGACCKYLVDDIHNCLMRIAGKEDSIIRERSTLSVLRFGKEGFSDPTTSGLNFLPNEIRIEYARGAAALLRHRHASTLGGLLGQGWRIFGASATNRFLEPIAITAHLSTSSEIAAGLTEKVVRALMVEEVSLGIMRDFQSVVHASLGFGGSVPQTRETVEMCFGALPSSYVKQVFCEIPIDFEDSCR
jgi:hypothetical protein